MNMNILEPSMENNNVIESYIWANKVNIFISKEGFILEENMCCIFSTNDL